MTTDLAPSLAQSLSLPLPSVRATLDLLQAGNTIPFLARYRKEATGNLDEVQLRAVRDAHASLSDLNARRDTIVKAIQDQDKLTLDLHQRLLAATTRADLEDLYAPFKRKRRTRASTARERGLAPLADRILDQPLGNAQPLRDAARFVNPDLGVPSPDDALAGARDIVAERIAEHTDVRAAVREALLRHAHLTSRVVPAKAQEDTVFTDYHDHREPLRSIPSHRYLALLRGEREGFLRLRLDLDTDRLLARLLRITPHNPRSPYAEHLRLALHDGYKRLLAPSLSNDVHAHTRERAEHEAIAVFAANLQALLLAPPAGAQPVLAIDPGLRTGCKCAALDATGAVLATDTLYLVGSRSKPQAAAQLTALVRRHRPFAVVVGNGTGGRETQRFAQDALRDTDDLRTIPVVSTSEAGASVYSASDIARAEFPDLDVSLRGAVSIGRRFQDPLAELVKIDPKAIGVGQYQHDVHQPSLQTSLDDVVESCVNRVGVTLNTASAALLRYVAGIGPSLAQRIVDHRTQHGPFRSRRDLLRVSGLGPKTFEQAAGFVRLPNGAHPLDASAVHPERYTLVERIARDLGLPLPDLIGDRIRADRIDLRPYLAEGIGAPTLRDIVRELKQPGRDPRDRFEPPRFRDDVNDLRDLHEGMTLDGVITNVTNFGAFVDIGVHHDGLVHISQLADRFVRNPHDVARVGQRLTVRVLSVDLRRKRISLSARDVNPS